MKRYLKNSGFGVMQLICSVALIFFSIPIFIRSYGLDMYGYFSVIVIFSNLNSLFNLGLNTTLVKLITGEKDVAVRNRQVSVSVCIIICITIIISLILFFCDKLIIGNKIDAEPILKSQVINAFRIFLLSNFLVMIGQPFLALMQSFHDFYKVSILQFAYSLCNWGLIIIFSIFHFSFAFIAYPALFASFIWLLWAIIIVFKKYNFRIVLDSKHNVIATAKHQLGYSLKVYSVSILSFFNEPLLRIVVVHVLGAAAAGNLDIILKVKTQIVSIAYKIFVPLTSIIASKQNENEIRDLVHYSQQLAIFLLVPISFAVCLTADPILKIWLKNITPETIFSIKLTIVFYLCSLTVLPNYYYLMFHNKLYDCMRIILLCIVTSFIFFAVFSKILNELAPVAGLCAGLIFSFILNSYYQWKYLRSFIINKDSLSILLLMIGFMAIFIIAGHYNLMVVNLLVVAAVLFISGKKAYILYQNGSLTFLR